MKFQGFVGGSAQHLSRNVNDERTYNWYVEHPAGMPKADPILQRTPGLDIYCELDDSPVRALFHQDDRTFAVAGETFYEIFDENSWTSRGSVVMDNPDEPAFISSNGTSAGGQLFVVSGQTGYIFTLATNVFAAIVDPQFPASALMSDHVDGYFVVLNTDTNTFQLSDLLNGASWDGTMIASRNMASDSLVALAVVHRGIWLFGRKWTEVWGNSGANFPFEPILSVGLIESGCIAPFSVCRIDNSIMWLGSDERGALNVMRADGYHPVIVSTPAVSEALRHYTNPHKAIGYAYQESGYTHYCLYFPEGPDPSSGFDHTHHCLTVNVGPELGWHQRSLWTPANGLWNADIPRCHCYDATHKLQLVGDRRTGAVYTQSLDHLSYSLVEP